MSPLWVLLGVLLIVVSVAVAPATFPFNLPLAFVGGWLVGARIS